MNNGKPQIWNWRQNKFLLAESTLLQSQHLSSQSVFSLSCSPSTQEYRLFPDHLWNHFVNRLTLPWRSLMFFSACSFLQDLVLAHLWMSVLQTQAEPKIEHYKTIKNNSPTFNSSLSCWDKLSCWTRFPFSTCSCNTLAV